MSDEVLVDGVVMQKRIDGVEYARCFHCGKFFTPGVLDSELQLFCSDECEREWGMLWDKEFKKWQKEGGHF